MAFDTDQLVAHINSQHAEMMAATKDQIGKVLAEQGTMRAEIDDMTQKLARRGASYAAPAANGWAGEQVVASDGYKNFVGAQNLKGRTSIKLSVTTAAGSAGALIPPDHREAVLLPHTTLTVRSLLSQARTSSDLVKYPKMESFTNAADAVSEGTLKPESDMTFTLEEASVKTLAHWIPASRQAVADAPQLQSLIDSELRFGLAAEEELQLLLGDGSGEQLLGLIPQATAFSEPFQPEMSQRLDTLLLAIVQLSVAKYQADGIIIHPVDWGKLQATKDTDGNYLGAGPFGQALKLAWQVPVVTSLNMTQGKFLVGAFKRAATIYDREDVTVEISTEHSDYFVRNLIAVLCESRLALAVQRPDALIYGTFQTST